MTTRELQDEIIRLKKEKDVCVLAHAYMSRDICEVADFVGDSFGLSRQAAKAEQQTVLMCGVRFMAETVKMLSPQKKVILSNPVAGCPMAEQIDRDMLLQLKESYPGYTVVAYINTTAELKTVCDVCVTSSSAVQIIRNIDNDKILFVPDCNLGSYIAQQVPEKEIALMRGGCPTHVRISEQEVLDAKKRHPEALLLMHPECRPEIVKYADYVGSTTGIMAYAEKSDRKEFVIGTENAIVQHLQFACPDKKFYALSKDCVCHNMKATTLMDVLDCVKGEAGEEIVMSEALIRDARRCIDEMLRLGDG
ncbi:MAG: quinolinate synthase NadA [Clostridia bacterium]|nr:quinolinate synthase NadA [Clostridia bacterium]